MDDDLHTRLTLLERTAVSRDQIAEREDRLLERFEELLKRDRKQASEERQHERKMLHFELGEQFRVWSDKIHAERDERLDRREAERAPPPPPPQALSPIRAWVASNWAWAIGIALLIVALRPDLAAAAFRVLT